MLYKGVTSLRLLKKFPQLRQELWRGCYGLHHIIAAGHVSAEVIEKHIQGQQMKMKRNSSTG
ncbi:MAG: hypothetical protein WAM14_22260 [Candidatus Nitrosopolaris sp.]